MQYTGGNCCADDQKSGEDNGALTVQYVVEIKHLNERTTLSLRST